MKILAAALLFGFGLGGVCFGQSLPAPKGQHVVLTVDGRGAQIYRCDDQDGKATWVFQGPDADLFLNGEKVGTHAGTAEGGPVWTIDGGMVHGKVLIKKPGRHPADDVPWLLLTADGAPATGRLAGVTYIERSKTRGGQALSADCDKARLGAVSRMPYFATYTFFAAGK